VKKKEEGVRKGFFCWTRDGSLTCVEVSQQSGSEGLGTEGFFLGRKTEGKRRVRSFVTESLAMFVIFRCV